MKDEDTPPGPFNCRCVAFINLPWQVEIIALLDEHIGNTRPIVPEFKREYVGVLNYQPPKLFP